MDWQPIETAPKDGTNILVCAEDVMSTVKWDDFFKEWALVVSGSQSEDDEFYGPTHWMPLPPPPKCLTGNILRLSP